MVQAFALVMSLLLAIFWLWMFADMVDNEAIPSPGFTSLRWPPETKGQWVIFFIVGNVFTAAYYYFSAYKKP